MLGRDIASGNLQAFVTWSFFYFNWTHGNHHLLNLCNSSIFYSRLMPGRNCSVGIKCEVFHFGKKNRILFKWSATIVC